LGNPFGNHLLDTVKAGRPKNSGKKPFNPAGLFWPGVLWAQFSPGALIGTLRGAGSREYNGGAHIQFVGRGAALNLTPFNWTSTFILTFRVWFLNPFPGNILSF